MEEKTAQQEWVARRISAVRQAYSAYDCMVENGYGDMLVDETTSVQTACPYHGLDQKPSARFYPAGSGRSYDILRCFKCKENWDCIALHAKSKGLEFMEALRDLERRFHVRVPKRPDAPEFAEPADRRSDYVSDKWADVPRMLVILESKLSRVRESAPLQDFIKFCRVLDSVQWDLDKSSGQVNPAMVQILLKLRDVMDAVQPVDPLS